jgi:hypothetical protein
MEEKPARRDTLSAFHEPLGQCRCCSNIEAVNSIGKMQHSNETHLMQGQLQNMYTGTDFENQITQPKYKGGGSTINLSRVNIMNFRQILTLTTFSGENRE